MTHTVAVRRQSIDLLRIAAAFGIVYAHFSAPGYLLAGVGLGLFLILTAFLSFQTLDRGDGSRFWLGRLVRFALPWVAWSAVYWAIMQARFGGPDPALAAKAWSMWLIGPSEHLWYLPFVLVASPVVWLASKALRMPAVIWAAAIALGPVGAAALAFHDTRPPAPFVQWAVATTPTLYGLISAAAARHPLRAVSLAPALFIALATVPGVIWRDSSAAALTFGAALVFEAAWRLGRMVDDGGRARRVAALAFGIYLVHPLLILLWYKIVPMAGSDAGRVLGSVVVFLASIPVVIGIRRLPYGSFIA